MRTAILFAVFLSGCRKPEPPQGVGPPLLLPVIQPVATKPAPQPAEPIIIYGTEEYTRMQRAFEHNKPAALRQYQNAILQMPIKYIEDILEIAPGIWVVSGDTEGRTVHATLRESDPGNNHLVNLKIRGWVVLRGRVSDFSALIPGAVAVDLSGAVIVP